MRQRIHRRSEARVVAVEHPGRRLAWMFLGMLLLLLALAARAHGATDEVQVKVAPVKVKAGASQVVPVTVTIPRGWHLFALPALTGQTQKPTSLALTAGSGITATTLQMPAAKTVHIDSLAADANVYEGTIKVNVKVAAAKTAAAGKQSLAGELSYQACSDERCFFPKKLKFTLPVEVVK